MNDRQRDRIRTLMKKNRRTRGGYVYTVPSPELYPFQWLWDSCFHAAILSHLDTKAAYEEIRSVLSKPLQSGLLPHIIYWKKDYRVTNWGREMRGDIISQSWGTDGTSAITQPPIIAETIWNLHQRFENRSFLEEFYHDLRSYYLCLLSERDPEAIGLVGLINPDESGEDNSPRFDDAQGLAPDHTDHENLNKRIERITQNKDCNYDAAECMKKHFWIEDVSFNAIYIRGLKALANIAETIGERGDANIFRVCALQTQSAMREHMYEDGLFYSLQGTERRKIHIKTWNIFMPLYAKILEKEEAQMLIEEHLLSRETFWTSFPVPSTAICEPSYRRGDFWRGPTWMAVNWLIHKGLKSYGFDDIARTLKEKSIELVDQSGFREHYDAESGAGLGTRNFTWGALIIDMED